MGASEVKIDTIISAFFEENAYVFYLPGRDDCLVVDPGGDTEQLIAHLDQKGLTPAAILNTHGHGDHILGNEGLKKRFADCPLVIGSGDADKLTDANKNLSASIGLPMVSPPADVTVDDGQTYSAAGFDLQVREIPGHTAGHVVFLLSDQSPPVVFVGDVIFCGGIGRTDFPDGDFEQLALGIRTKLYDLPDETRLYPGHGPPTTVGEEKRSNPFVRQ